VEAKEEKNSREKKKDTERGFPGKATSL